MKPLPGPKGDSRGNPALWAAARAARREADVAAAVERMKAVLGEPVAPITQPPD